MESNIGKLAEALSKAQAEIQTPKKTQVVKWFDSKEQKEVVKYRYADLADIIDAIRIPFSKNGLSIIHQLEFANNNYGLKTSLMHSMGEVFSTWYPLPDPSKIKAQDFGGALTYARRYSLSSIVGIASEDDLDGLDAPIPDNPSIPDKPKQTFKPSNPQSNPQTQKFPNGETTVSKLVENQYKQKTQALKPSDPEYFDDLDNALGRSYQDPGPEMEPKKAKLKNLYDLVEQYKIPVDVIQVYIKQACGTQKKSDQMTEAEIDIVIQRIKLLNK